MELKILTKYDKNKQNIEEDENFYIILENKKKDKIEEDKVNEKFPSVTDIIKDKEKIYLSKSDKNKDEIEKDKNIYIINDENESNEEKIIYTEIIYEITKYKNYKQVQYIKSKNKPKKGIEDERITYLTKYNRNKQNVEENEIIYIILEEELEENVDKELPKDKKTIYLSKSDKNKDEIGKDKNK